MAKTQFVVTEDNISTFLAQLNEKQLVSAKRAALRSASNKLTRVAIQAFFTLHPPRPERAKGVQHGLGGITDMELEEAYTSVTENFAGGIFRAGFEEHEGGRRKSIFAVFAKRKVHRLGEWVDWFPTYLLDWFEYGTNDRATKGRRTIGRAQKAKGRRWYKVRAGRGHATGKIEAQHFLAAALRSVEADVFKGMAQTLADAVYRVYVQSMRSTKKK